MARRELTEQEIKDGREHHDVLLAIQAVGATTAGRILIKYLFKHQGVADLPAIGMEGSLLMDYLGSLRPGKEFFNLVSEADPNLAALLLAELKKVENAEKYAAYDDDERED